MNIARLHAILAMTTQPFRKGEPVIERQIGPLSVTEFHAMPARHETNHPDIAMVDLEMLSVGVFKPIAHTYKTELIALLRDYPEPDGLKDGPSYIEVGAALGSQHTALLLFALGEVLGLWKVITPGLMGAVGEAAQELAGSGFVMITGFKDTTDETA